MRNHARSILACDFFVAVTVTFRVFYFFVVLEVGTRRILHWNVTDHPTADWTAQQFRMVRCWGGQHLQHPVPPQPNPASQSQTALDCQFLSSECGHVMADDNPLREGLVHDREAA